MKRRSKRNGATERMRWKFDTPFGRDLYSRRMGTVEPVFGNLQNKGMAKIHTSWSAQSECTVEALHDGAQHREGGRGGHAAVAERGPAGPASASRTMLRF